MTTRSLSPPWTDLTSLSDCRADRQAPARRLFLHHRLHRSRDRPGRRHVAPGIAVQHRRRGLRAVLLPDRREERLDVARGRRAAQTLKTLRTFWDSTQSDQPDATGYKGFYYHFLHMQTRRRVWQCELSLVDTTLLLAGVLMAGCYFDAGRRRSRDPRAGRCALPPGRLAVGAESMDGRSPRAGSPNAVSCTTAGKATTRRPSSTCSAWARPPIRCRPDSFTDWTVTYQWENLLGQNVLYSGPLFTHLFSHAWIDFRGIRDKFMREKHSDYFENSRNSIALHREYGARNPARLRRIRPEPLGHHRRRRPGQRGAARGPSRPALLRLHRARRALRAGRRHHLALGDAGHPAVRRGTGDRGHAPSPANLPAGLQQGPLLQRLQSDLQQRPARAGCRKAGSGSTRACWC